MNPPQQHTLTLIKRLIRNPTTYSFFFQKTEMEYTAGQFIRITYPHEGVDERGINRFFSLCSAPQEDTYMITTRILQSSYKFALATLKEGSILNAFGPLGKFVMVNEGHHVFLSGGIGITPFRSMVLDATFAKKQTPITLIASYSHEEEMLFHEEFLHMEKENPNFQYIPTITGIHSTWKGKTGRVGKEDLKRIIPDYSSSLFYISGSMSMVQGMREEVTALSIPESQIKTEIFIGY